MLTLFKNIKSSLKINLSNFGNDRHMRHNKPQIDHVNVNFCWCYYCVTGEVQFADDRQHNHVRIPHMV